MDQTPQANAGTIESNDIFITITGNGSESDNQIFLESIVKKQFGTAIVSTIEDCLTASSLRGVDVSAKDKGALDCTIRARMETAITRYKGFHA